MAQLKHKHEWRYEGLDPALGGYRMIGAGPEALVIGVAITLLPLARTLSHPRIRLIEGSSTDPRTLERVEELCGSAPCLVILDSDHSAAHVLRELQLYSGFVEAGGYLV
jgi:cephalosporin hydroxylase